MWKLDIQIYKIFDTKQIKNQIIYKIINNVKIRQKHKEIYDARRIKDCSKKERFDSKGSSWSNIGVSFQTYNGYENGKKIPTTKYQILENVLYSFNQVNEPSAIYFTENGHDKTIKHLNELIVQREEILKILNPNSLDYYHNLEMIQMYKDRIKYINVAKQEGRK